MFKKFFSVGVFDSDATQPLDRIGNSLRYDILSFTESVNIGGISERFIEVKAVSSVDFKFYWSRNEIEAARIHSQNYFLYLIPISRSGFDMQKLTIIQNPFKRIYADSDSWSRQHEVVSFWSKE